MYDVTNRNINNSRILLHKFVERMTDSIKNMIDDENNDTLRNQIEEVLI